MRRIVTAILSLFVAGCFTSCGTLYYDAIPEPVSTMTIPCEGGSFEFKLVEYVDMNDTRFQPGYWFKYYRYRVVEDGIAGEVSDNMSDQSHVWIDFEPNDTGHTKEYTIDIQVAKEFYKYDEKHLYGEWQRVWKITQPSMP